MSQQLCDDLRQIRPDILDLDLVEGAIANGKGLQTPADWIPEPGDMALVQKGATVGIPELRTDRKGQDDAVLDKEGQLAENCRLRRSEKWLRSPRRAATPGLFL